ncbi:metallopeptidase-like protein 2 [Elsinoe australis]|uniref:Metallopeptidase-like protein 2 n=1 Tax=Elsinoe australis TaxID=40998 RepID=A0A4U7B476_9PEZI|nr:metallopeptidase-like protein 2 [Elsinoe australis]
MRSVSTLSTLALLGSLAAATPVSKTLETRTCSFDEANPLVIAESDVSRIARRQTSTTRPAALAGALDEVWKHTQDTRPADLNFKNYLFDQIIATKGKVNYCVRWESTKANTEAQRADTVTALRRSVNKWIDSLAGYDGWPYSDVEVNVVGYAVSNPSLLQGSTSGLDVYTTKDDGGIPQCDPRCGRFFNQDNDYSECPGGAARHYDVSLWLTDGMNGGAGGDWGERIGTDYFLGAIKQDSVHILLHEIGHGFGLDDFYDWTPTGTEGKFIMSAGGSTTITEFDTWMLRDWWSKAVKARFPSLPAASAAAPEEVASSTPFTSASASASSAPASETETETEVATSTPAFSTGTATVEVPTALPTGVFPTGAVPRPTGGVRWPRPGRGRGRGRGRRPVPTGRVESFAVFGQ